MRRPLLLLALLAFATSAIVAHVAGADDSHNYRIELNNAFGLAPGSNVKIAGVISGTVRSLDVNEEKKAVVEIEVSGPLSQFHADAHCSSEPQSLIAEYFIDCQPGTARKLLPDDALLNLSHTSETVQQDLLFNTLREPFRQRLTLILNEFGTGLAGNPQRLNAAIRHGVPALRKLRRAFTTISSERTTIRDLATNAEQIMSRLADRRQDVTSFVVHARRAADATAARRDDLARDLQLLPGFLAQLGPSMDRLRALSRASTPVLSDLYGAAGDLATLTRATPAFSAAAVPAVEALGETADAGKPVVAGAADEVRALRSSGRHLPRLAGNLAQLVRDLDDPKRATEVDSAAAKLSGRPMPTGYTGFEGLANLAYFLTNASNQFDQIGHLTQFSAFQLLTNPCTLYNATDEVPSKASTGIPPFGTWVPTKNPHNVHPCVMWLGPRQPGINVHKPHLDPYPPSVCPDGSTDLKLCNPGGSRVSTKVSAGGETGSAGATAATPAPGRGAPAPPGEAPPGGPLPQLPPLPGVPGTDLPNDPQDLLDLLGLDKGNGPLPGGGGLLPRRGRAPDLGGGAGPDLLDYLLGS